MLKPQRLIFGAVLLTSVVVRGQQKVRFDIDAQQDVKPISRFIYGINQFHLFQDGMDGPYSNCTFTRLGGNRLTAYNWTDNASNAGSDYHFENDDYLVMGSTFDAVRDAPGGANIPSIETAYQHNAAILLTIPINGYVSADKKLDEDIHKVPDYVHTRFKPEEPKKNAPFTVTPNPNAPVVYEDEFVNWVKTKYPYGQSDPLRPIWFSMDNEPDWWSHTHSEIHPDPVTYAELLEKNISYASAVKDVMPGALVFGPVNYGWHGYISLQDAPDANGRDFQEFYLQNMADAEKSQHRRLLDVFDVHYYPEATGDGIRIIMDNRTQTAPAVVAARLAAPRSLWDPNYTETSWITKDSTHGPIRLIPRLKEKIDTFYPGTKLAITEYDFGGGDHISGGIAQADALGIFGREGVFAAALWPSKNIPFDGAAFQMYRDFDGNNATFGDTSISAKTSDLDASSVYASLDSNNPSRMVMVAINKTDKALATTVQLDNANVFTQASVYQLTSADPKPHPAGNIQINGSSFDYTMPAYSVSTLQLTGSSKTP